MHCSKNYQTWAVWKQYIKIKCLTCYCRKFMDASNCGKYCLFVKLVYFCALIMCCLRKIIFFQTKRKYTIDRRFWCLLIFSNIIYGTCIFLHRWFKEKLKWVRCYFLNNHLNFDSTYIFTYVLIWRSKFKFSWAISKSTFLAHLFLNLFT